MGSAIPRRTTSIVFVTKVGKIVDLSPQSATQVRRRSRCISLGERDKEKQTLLDASYSAYKKSFAYARAHSPYYGQLYRDVPDAVTFASTALGPTPRC